MSSTQLPHNGEAALAEVALPNGKTAIVFNGRSRRHGFPRGVAWSYDDGATFQKLRFAVDRSAGISCLASLISDPVNRSALLFSHPNGSAHGPRSDGVVLRSTDAAESWQVAEWVPTLAPTGPMFAYSNLNEMADGGVGLTYETGDSGCEKAASACRIIFRVLSRSIGHDTNGLTVISNSSTANDTADKSARWATLQHGGVEEDVVRTSDARSYRDSSRRPVNAHAPIGFVTVQ